MHGNGTASIIEFLTAYAECLQVGRQGTMKVPDAKGERGSQYRSIVRTLEERANTGVYHRRTCTGGLDTTAAWVDQS
jgi:hypothetical protein